MLVLLQEFDARSPGVARAFPCVRGLGGLSPRALHASDRARGHIEQTDPAVADQPRGTRVAVLWRRGASCGGLRPRRALPRRVARGRRGGHSVSTDKPDRGEVVVFEAGDGSLRLDVRLKNETVWLSRRHIAELLDTSTDNVGLHLKNIYAEGELDEAATAEEASVVQVEGRRRVTRRVRLYSLDAILSVGYRVNSKRGTQFRIWATSVLREHLVRGYTIHRQRFERNARELEAALELVRKTAGSAALSNDQRRGLVDVIARYTQTFLLLQRYDERLLSEPKGAAGGVLPKVTAARSAIAKLKRDLVARGQATDLFGREREQGLASLLGNLDQSVFGKPA